MKTINLLAGFLLRKEFYIPAILIVLFLALHVQIEFVLSKTIVNHVLSFVPSVWYLDIVFFLTLIGVVIVTVYRFGRYTPSLPVGLLSLLAAMAYLIYRLKNQPWEFTSLAITPHVKYTDLIFIFLVSQIVVLTKSKVKSTKAQTKPPASESFLHDIPIRESSSDLFGYEQYAKSLSTRILNSSFEQAFAIGINGKWGNGKTSFINLIKNNLKVENIVEVEFNPWNSQNSASIIQDFFSSMQDEIKPYHSNLSKLLLNYSNKLISVHDSSITQSIKSASETLYDFESLGDLYLEINKSLQAMDRKLVVYIDDLDRLDKAEVVEVVRLIRNTANFHNTFFIVAYDRNYVVTALKSHLSYREESFLEKIFQVEVTLPYFDKNILRDELFSILKQHLPEIWHSDLNDAIYGRSVWGAKFSMQWIDNMRDVTRFINSILLNLENLHGEVYLIDLLNIELLRLKYPSVYSLLYQNTSDFLETVDHNGQKPYYQLRYVKQKYHAGQPTAKNSTESKLEKKLRKAHLSLSIPKEEIKGIYQFLTGVFKEDKYFHHRAKNHLSIIFPSRFKLYFAYNLLKNLSEVEFVKARLSELDHFKNKISQWIQEGLERELKSRFQEITDYDNKEDFEKIIAAIFYLGNHPSKYNEPYSTNIVDYSAKDLFDKVFRWKDIEKKYYKEEPSGALKVFLQNLFDAATYPYNFESKLLYSWRESYFQGFIFSKTELQNQALIYLTQFCEKSTNLTHTLYSLFHTCKLNQHQEAPEKAKELLRNFGLNKDLDGFIESIVDPEPFGKGKFKISGIVVQLFNSWHEFEKIIVNLERPTSLYLNEFKLFMKALKVEDYNEYVDFEFNTIPTRNNS